jgi:hypothetical protein
MNRRRPWDVEDATLYALCARAWELRGTTEFDDAITAILDAYDRAPLTWFERCEQRHSRNQLIVRVLRETDPDQWREVTA